MSPRLASSGSSRRPGNLLAALGVALVLVACIDVHPNPSECSASAPSPAVNRSVEYHRDVAPILARRCLRCHDGEGSGPLRFVMYEEARDARALIRHAVETRAMPPWPPAGCCNRYRRERALSDEELATVLGWVDQGAPEGAPAPPPSIGRAELDRVDLELAQPEPYLPNPPPGATDETRCFLLDWPERDVRYVTGVDLRSSHPAQVHHALVLIASSADTRRLEEEDARSPGPGWPCPGGIVSSFKGFLGGSFFEAQQYDSGLGQEVRPDDKLVLTLHFSRPPQGDFRPEQTRVLLRHQAEPTRPMLSLTVVNPSWLMGGMVIPAGAPDVGFTYADEPTLHTGGRPLRLHAVNLHMHERGTRGTVAILRSSGEQECLLQIDRWDHAWQGDYWFEEPPVLNGGDRLVVECRFDNSPENQRWVAGGRQEPKTLNWGEDQEMCVAFVTATPAE